MSSETFQLRHQIFNKFCLDNTDKHAPLQFWTVNFHNDSPQVFLARDIYHAALTFFKDPSVADFYLIDSWENLSIDFSDDLDILKHIIQDISDNDTHWISSADPFPHSDISIPSHNSSDISGPQSSQIHHIILDQFIDSAKTSFQKHKALVDAHDDHTSTSKSISNHLELIFSTSRLISLQLLRFIL